MGRPILRSLVVVLVAAAGIGWAGAARADSPSPCTHADFMAPVHLSVVTQYPSVESPLETDCTQPFLSEKFSATWDAVAANSAVVDEVWYHTTSNPGDWDEDPAIGFADNVRLGLWTWRPKAGFTDVQPPDVDETLTVAEMNTPTTDVRVGSATAVTAMRVGGKVTVSTQATRYWTSTHRFGTWGRAVGIIQYRVPGTSTWKGLKNVSADNYGTYSYTYTVSSTREYRAIMFNATYVWGSSNPVPVRK